MGFFDAVQSANGSVWLAHLLFIPAYMLLGTAKHEYAHAIAAKRQGLTVTRIQLFPHIRDGNFYWGYVSWTGAVVADSGTYMAPYIVDAILLALGSLVIWLFVPMAWWIENSHVFFVTTIIGLILPIFDIGYNFMKWRFRKSGDFWEVFGKVKRFGGVL